MGNTLGATPGALIARGAIDTLLEEYPMLRMFTLDASGEEALLNQQVNIKIPNALTAGDYNATDGYAPQDVSQEDIPVTINQHPYVCYKFSDTERTSHDTLLIERFARNAGHALGKRLMTDLFTTITVANFPNGFAMPSAVYSREKILQLSEKLNERKVPRSGRFIIANSAGYRTLANDLTLVANAGSPSATVRTGEIGDVHGFKVIEFPFLPTNAQQLNGIAGVAEGLIVATRVPTLPEERNRPGVNIELVTEPTTQITIQVRSWYDARFGAEYRTFTLMHGVSKGDVARLERITE